MQTVRAVQQATEEANDQTKVEAIASAQRLPEQEGRHQSQMPGSSAKFQAATYS